MSNIFRAIIHHVQATVAAELALGHPAVVARLRAEGAFFYEEEIQAPADPNIFLVGEEAITPQRVHRLFELHNLMSEAKGAGRAAAGASLETVEARLSRLQAAVAVFTSPDRGGLEELAGVVHLALQDVFSLADAVPATAVEGSPDTVYMPPPLPVVNSFQLRGVIWHVCFGEVGEAGDFPDRQDSVLRRLARLLAEPNRRFGALDFYPSPTGTATLPDYGRDASSDERALKEYEQDMRGLVREIKEADDAHDTETATRLRARLDAMTRHHKGELAARKRGHKKRCGIRSSAEKADNALRMGLERIKQALRRNGLPKMAEHLDKYLSNSEGEWWYAPPPDAFPWDVIRPDPPSEN